MLNLYSCKQSDNFRRTTNKLKIRFMAVKCYVEKGDHVYCHNCETEMLISYGEEVCPNCGQETLMWASDEEQESSVDEFDKKGLDWEWSDNLTFTD